MSFFNHNSIRNILKVLLKIIAVSQFSGVYFSVSQLLRNLHSSLCLRDLRVWLYDSKTLIMVYCLDLNGDLNSSSRHCSSWQRRLQDLNQMEQSPPFDGHHGGMGGRRDGGGGGIMYGRRAGEGGKGSFNHGPGGTHPSSGGGIIAPSGQNMPPYSQVIGHSGA